MGLREQLRESTNGKVLRPYFVPEWGTKGATIYYYDLRGNEIDAIRAVTPSGATAERSNAQIVATKALDENGVRIFPKAEDADEIYGTDTEPGLMHPTVITRIATKFWSVPTDEAAEKNSGANQTA